MGSDLIGFWLDSAGRAPLLTAGQEITLGRYIQTWLNAEDPTPQVMRRGRRAKDRLIKSNLKLVASISAKYLKRIEFNSNVEQADLLQEGIFGLNRAAEKFDPEAG